jgi:octanoyl-[GcvH]:protein N-octanoyltransferase
VLVVKDAGRVRDVLIPVYQALGLEWDPATVGSVEDELGAVEMAAAEDAMLAELAARYELVETELDPETLRLAETMEADHLSPR